MIVFVGLASLFIALSVFLLINYRAYQLSSIHYLTAVIMLLTILFSTPFVLLYSISMTVSNISLIRHESFRVARMTDFGAVVELEPGVDALLHVSQISQEHVEKPSDVLSVGQEITAKVADFNGEDKKISLSMKALEQPEEASEETAAE